MEELLEQIWTVTQYGAAVTSITAMGIGIGRLYQWLKHSKPEYKRLEQEYTKELTEKQEKINGLEKTVKEFEEQEEEQKFIGILREVVTTEKDIEDFAKEVKEGRINAEDASFDIKLKVLERYAKGDPKHDTRLLARKWVVYTVTDITELADIYAQFKEGEETCRIDITGTSGPHGILEATKFDIFEDYRLKEALQENLPVIWKRVRPKFDLLDELIEKGIFEGKQKKVTLEDLSEKQVNALEVGGYFTGGILDQIEIDGIGQVVYEPYNTVTQAIGALRASREIASGIEAYWERKGPKPKEVVQEPEEEIPGPPPQRKTTIVGSGKKAPKAPKAPKKKPPRKRKSR